MKRRDFFPALLALPATLVAAAEPKPRVRVSGEPLSGSVRVSRPDREALERIAELNDFEHITEAKEIAREALTQEED